MALLRVIDDDRVIHLSLSVLVGRNSTCDLMVPDARVSGAHLQIAWRSGCWTVRDLNSRNGSWLSGTQLMRGEERPWPLDEIVQLASSGPTLALIDDAPPPAYITCQATGDIVYADCGMIGFPSPDSPMVTIYRRDGDWVAEVDAVTFTVVDGQVLAVAETEWMLTLNPEVDRTLEALAEQPQVQHCGLRFEVSSDEERVRMWLVQEGVPHLLPERRYHYLLLTLARKRLDDTKAGHGSDAGWLDREQLYQMLRTDREAFNRDVFRARKQLAAAGLNNANDIIEVWGDSRRIGISQIDVVTL
jgi:hypothetical protein